MCKVSQIKKSTLNVERGRYAKKNPHLNSYKNWVGKRLSAIWKELYDIFHNVEGTI